MLGTESHHLLVEAYDNGSFSFASNSRVGNKTMALYFTDVNISDKSVAELLDGKFLMDYDGDGTIDYSIEPDFVEESEEKGEEKDYSLTENLTFEKEKGLNVLYIIVPALILIVFVILIIKKKSISS
ncbi:MAG: hypothetical protein KJ601_00460 [Nanoarchaeota archaeon]|nr:hypothetical protein [Nanoarchaeota archaeon]